MPDPIDMPHMNALPDPSERIYESSASRATHDNEAFMSELQRRREQQPREEDEENPPHQEDDTYERSYKDNQDQSKKMMLKKSKDDEVEAGSPGQVIDIKI